MYSRQERARIQQEVCDRIANGESLIKICKSEGMPKKNTVLAWVIEDAEFSNQYARAREAQADHYLDEIVEISDQSALDTEIDPASGNEVTNHEVIQRARLRVDTRKWVMSKLAPKKYGDKLIHSGDPANPVSMLLSSVQGASLPIAQSETDTDN